MQVSFRSRVAPRLQQRAEAMTSGDFSALGQPIGDVPELEDLRRAIDVLGTHTEQGLRRQHAYIATLSRSSRYWGRTRG